MAHGPKNWAQWTQLESNTHGSHVPGSYLGINITVCPNLSPDLPGNSSFNKLQSSSIAWNSIFRNCAPHMEAKSHLILAFHAIARYSIIGLSSNSNKHNLDLYVNAN